MRNPLGFGNKNGFILKRNGFTLIEVMIVLAVAGILAIVAVPKYQAIQEQYKLEAAAQTVVAELRFAKQLAMDQRSNAFVTFTETGITLQLVSGSTLDVVETKPFAAGIIFDPARNSTLSQHIFQGYVLGQGIQFDPQGFAINSGSITLNNSRGRTVAIVVSPETGNISIEWP